MTPTPVVVLGAGAGNLPLGDTLMADDGISIGGVATPTEEHSPVSPMVRRKVDITAVFVGNVSLSPEAGGSVNSVPSYLPLHPGAR